MAKWHYMHKEDGAVLMGPWDGPDDVTVDTDLKKKDDRWGHIIDAKNAEEFMERARALGPYDYVINHDKLRSYAEKHWPEAKPLYTPDTTAFTRVLPVMERWLDEEFTKKERPKTLVLWGPSRTGKTQWARALNHILAQRTGGADDEDIGESCFLR